MGIILLRQRTLLPVVRLEPFLHGLCTKNAFFVYSFKMNRNHFLSEKDKSLISGAFLKWLSVVNDQTFTDASKGV